MGVIVQQGYASAAGGGDVTKVGTPADNQIGVWTGDGTIEGDSALTFDTTTDTLAIAASGNLAFGAVTVLDDNAGTATLSNIDALDATTEATIEAAIDTLANLVSVQGRTVTLADAGADALFGWDDSASAYQNLSAADARTALGLSSQTWQAVTRVNDTSYQNTTGQPIQVVSWVSMSGGASTSNFEVSPNNSSWTTIIAASGSGASGVRTVTINVIIPVNYYYRCNNWGSKFELR